MPREHSASLSVLTRTLVGLVTSPGLTGCVAPTPTDQGPPPPPSPPLPAPSFTVLHSFSGGADGSHPTGLVRDDRGNLYGTTFTGGDPACAHTGYSDGCGTIFKFGGNDQFETLHTFTGGPGDGAAPWSGLIRDAAGTLYGGTLSGGVHGFGVIYRLDVNGNFTILHNFTGGIDGTHPNVSFRDGMGNLYGTTLGRWTPFSSSRCVSDCGTIFRLDPAGTLTTLHQFHDLDGTQPLSPLLPGDAGDLYGTTSYGGSPSACPYRPLGCGTIYRLAAGNQFATLHSLVDSAVWDEGNAPTGTLAWSGAGILYGTTLDGGSQGGGTVYRFRNGVLTTLHSFVAPCEGLPGDPDGQNPEGGVLLGADGKLYGTTSSGGTWNWGTVFALDIQSGVLRTLHAFRPQVGGGPVGPLIADGDGNLFGTGFVGGNQSCPPAPGCGIVFMIKLR